MLFILCYVIYIMLFNQFFYKNLIISYNYNMNNIILLCILICIIIYMTYYDKYIKYKQKYKLLKLEEMIKNKITITLYNMNIFINYALQNKDNKKILLNFAQKYKHDDLINLLSEK